MTRGETKMDDAERIKRINQDMEHARTAMQSMGTACQDVADRALALSRALAEAGRRRAAELQESRKGWAKR